MGNKLLSECMESFLRWGEGRFSSSTIAFYAHFLRKLSDGIGPKPIDEVTTMDIELVSPKRHCLLTAKRFFGWAWERAKLISVDPSADIRLPIEGRRTRTLQRTEAVRFRRRSRRHLRNLLLALECTAGRPQEIREATWSQIRAVGAAEWTPELLRAGECYLQLESFKGVARRTVSRSLRVIPISARLGRLIARISSKRSDKRGTIFLNSHGQPWSANALRCAFRRLRPKVTPCEEEGAERIVPYTYRHTLATELARRGANGRLLADFLGHAGLDLLGTYVHPSVTDLADLLKRKAN